MLLEIKKDIVFFYFSSTRKYNTHDLFLLSLQFNTLLTNLKTSLCECDDIVEIDTYISYFIVLYKLIVYTRDIDSGKGERDLTYMMIDIWYDHFPNLAKYILEILPENYGSWKDLKYFCKYTQHETKIDYCIELWNNQLEMDIENDDDSISLVSKWIPREKSTFGWLFERSVKEWNYRTNRHIYTTQQKKEYRTILSSLNKRLNTSQIKETQNKWSELIPENIPLVTKTKQYNAFLNKRKIEDFERIKCQQNFEDYYTKKNTNTNVSKKRKSFHLGEYLKNPHLQNQYYWNEIKADILQNRKREKKKYLLPIVNISLEHPEEYMNAISIGCMISEISDIKDHIILYDENPHIINISDCNIEIKKKRILQKTWIKGKSNIVTTLHFLKDMMQNTIVKEEDQKNITMIIISDFSVEPYDLDNKITTIFGKKTPKMIYWNIGSRIPLFKIPMHHINISGCSSSILKSIYETIDSETIDSETIDIEYAYFFITNLLSSNRYKEVEDFFKTKIKEED